MYPVTCVECGKEYFSAVNRNGYCDECRSKKIAETKHNYYETRKVKRAEVRDKLKKCTECGRIFNAVKSDQELCDKCQFLKENNYRMTASNQYRKDFKDVIQIKVQKGRRDELKEIAGKYGMNLTTLIVQSIDFYQSVYDLPREDIDKIEAIIKNGRKKKQP